MIRQSLVRALLIVLAFTSVTVPLSALPGSVLDFWYLYYSPVLISAFSFGLRGALVGSAATILSLTILLQRFQEVLRLAPQDALLRIVLLSGTPGPGFRQLVQQLAQALSSGQTPAPDTSGDLVLAVAKVGLGVLTVTLAACLLGWQVDRQRSAEQAVQREARTDRLTGLANYRSLMEELDQAVVQGTGFSLLLIDLDNLKDVNDGYGHLVGDQALVHVTNLIRQTVRSGDLIARYGGDEFVVMLPDADADAAGRVGQRLLQGAAEYPLVLPDGQAVPLGLSIGVVGGPRQGYKASELLRAADAAMYAAKQAGGHQAVMGLPVEASPQAEPGVTAAG